MGDKKTLQDLIKENVFEQDFKEEIVEIKLTEIKPNPYQPRYVFDADELNKLADSIRENGVIQPIIVKKVSDYYTIIAGERRYRASKIVGLKTIPAIIRQYEKSKMIELALIENIQRQNLSPVEEAKAYNQIMKELDLTQSEVAKRVGKDRSYVTNMLGLLNLPKKVLDMVDSNKISMGHARALSKLEDTKRIAHLANKIVSDNLSVRQIEEMTKNEVKRNKTKKRSIKDFSSFENSIVKKLHLNTKVNSKKVSFLFDSEEETLEFINKILKDK